MKWKDAVKKAIERHCRSRKSNIFTRKGLIKTQLDRIITDTDSIGDTPGQTLSRVLQELKKSREIDFIDYHGKYRKLF